MSNWTKRVLSVMLVCMLIGGAMPLVASGASYGSNGKFLAPIDPPAAGSIAISTRAQLEAIKNDLNGKYHLINDINLSGAEWAPIGDNSTSNNSSRFSGTFDGQGYVIRNLTISGEGYENNGLFGYSAGTIKNVGMEGTSITITNSTDIIRAGAICGISYLTSNCYNTGNISVIANSSSSSSNANIYAGGICGTGGSVYHCFNTGDISVSSSSPMGSYSHAGGISGGAGSDRFIRNSFNAGNISATAYTSSTTPTSSPSGYRAAEAFAGGIAGFNSNSVATTDTVSSCYNIGNITSVSGSAATTDTAYAGGISGSGPQTNSYNKGSISATGSYRAYAGGISGRVTSGRCNTNYNVGAVNVSGGSNASMRGGITTYGGNVYNSYCLDLYGSQYGSQLTSAQMKDKANYVGFDFDTTWDISPSVNNGYPYLKAITASTPATYSLTLNANGGTVTPTSASQAQGTTYTLPTPTRSGYTFAGWTLSGGGSLNGNVYTFGTSNGTVTAGWTANVTNYTLTLNANGGVVTPTSATQAQGTTYTLPTPTRDGHAFTGWTLSGGGSLNGSTYTFGTNNGTVTAGWTASTPAKGIFGTNAKWNGAWWHYILFFVGFGFIWMWF